MQRVMQDCVQFLAAFLGIRNTKGKTRALKAVKILANHKCFIRCFEKSGILGHAGIFSPKCHLFSSGSCHPASFALASSLSRKY
jgi:hypothetical protein